MRKAIINIGATEMDNNRAQRIGWVERDTHMRK